MIQPKKPETWEEGEKERLQTIVGGFCWAQDGGNGGYDFEDIVSFINDKITTTRLSAAAEERKRVCEEILENWPDRKRDNSDRQTLVKARKLIESIKNSV